jgi:hypothetical protein
MLSEPFPSEGVYVSIETEEGMAELIKPFGNFVQFLLGLTGSGKSTLIRHVTGVTRANPQRIDILERRIYSVISFDHAVLSAKLRFDPDVASRILQPVIPNLEAQSPANYLKSILEAVDSEVETQLARMLAAMSDDLLKTFQNPSSDKELCNYVVAIGRKELCVDQDQEDHEVTPEALRRFRKRDWFRYELLRLKWVARQCKLRSVSFVLDDIEPLPYYVQESFVKHFIVIFGCITRTEAPYFKSAFFISCRPSTYALLQRKNAINFRQIRQTPIFIALPPKLREIVDTRMAYLLEHDEDCKALVTRKGWERTRISLDQALNELVVGHGLTMSLLHNYDVRKALEHMRSILENRRHFQNDAPVLPSFDVWEQFQTAEYRINDAVVLKSIALNDSNFYDGGSPEENPIVNILENEADPAYDLLGAYLVYYGTLPKFRKLWGRDAFTANEVCDLFEQRFGWRQFDKPKIEEKLSQLTLKGVFELLETTARERIYCLLPRGNILWTMLGETSLLVSFYRDDTFIEHTIDNDMLTCDLHDACHLALAQLEFCEHFAKQELPLFRCLLEYPDRKRKYKLMFPKPVSAIILNAVSKGFYAILHRGRPKQVVDAEKQVKEKVQDLLAVVGLQL